MAAAAEVEQKLAGGSQPADVLLASSIQQLSLAEASSAAADRDSANHSPSDFLSGNNHSDTHSVSSNDNDSGKGGSDCAAAAGESSRFDVMTPPLSPAHGVHGSSSSSTASLSISHVDHLISNSHVHTMVSLPERLFVYEFEIPQALCGLVIGRFGAFVSHIRTKTGASLIIKKHPSNRRLKLCAIEGTKVEIDAALEVLREKFPAKKFPQVTLEQVNVATVAATIVPDSIQLQLPAEVSCDVIVSAVVTPNHIFVQQVTQPTYPSLANLDHCMAVCYNECETPALPRPIQTALICAAPSLGGWYRAKVVAVHPAAKAAAAAGVEKSADDEEEVVKQLAAADVDDDEEEVDICFVDYGGYARVPASSLRQIRADFMTLPFQAVECLLANVAPQDEEAGWTMDAYTQLESLTSDRLLQVQVMAYSLEGPPLVYLYSAPESPETGPVLVNRQLVTRQVALWVEPQVSPPDDVAQ